MKSLEAKFLRLLRRPTVHWHEPELWSRDYPLLSEIEQRRVLTAALWAAERRGEDLPQFLCQHVREALPTTEKPWTPLMNKVAAALLQGKTQYAAAKEAGTTPQAIQSMRKRSKLFARIYEAAPALHQYAKTKGSRTPAPLWMP